MRTPNIPKNTNQGTLASKKKKKKEIIKNVLASPFTKYWPVISDSESATLRALIAKHLPQLNVFLSKERSKKTEEMRCEPLTKRPLEYPINRQIEHGVTLGINDTAKALEKQENKEQEDSVEITKAQQKRLHAVLINDVRPKVLVEHLIQLCVLKNVPVLIVSNLAETVARKCGIRSSAVGLGKRESYNNIHQMIQTISKNYPIPKNHINAQRSKGNEDDVKCDVPQENLIKTSVPDNSNIYLKQTDTSQRVFVPPGTSDSSSGFMAFNDGSSDNPICKLYSGNYRQGLGEYHPLKIAKYQAFVDRSKNKIENMKKQKKKKNKVQNTKKDVVL